MVFGMHRGIPDDLRVAARAAVATGLVLLILAGLAGRAWAGNFTVYVANYNASGSGPGTVTPILTALNQPLPPITVGGNPSSIAITPDGATAYVGAGDGVTPIATTTNTARQAIYLGYTPSSIGITPDGTTAYVASFDSVTPIDLTTGVPGAPLAAGSEPGGIAITPDGKTAYVTSELAAGIPNVVTPIAIATNTLGPPIQVGRGPFAIAITPDGKTAYVTNLDDNTVTPITIATNAAGPPIPVVNHPWAIAITPDDKTAYVAGSGITPISLATQTPEPPIAVDGRGIAITPDGATAYVTNPNRDTVTPITLATRTPGLPIPVGTAPEAIAIAPEATPTAHETLTSVRCWPRTVVVGTSTTCTALVTDTSAAGPATPTGTVSFTSDGPGSFADSSCILSGRRRRGRCEVSYTPGEVGTGHHVIRASYSGDASGADAHLGSSGLTSVHVRTYPRCGPKLRVHRLHCR